MLFFRNEGDTSTDSELFKGAASIESQRSIFFDKSRLYWTHLLRFPKIYELHDINNYILILGFCCYVLLTIKH